MYPNLPIVKVFVDYYFCRIVIGQAHGYLHHLIVATKKSETIYHSNYSEKILIASPHNAS